VSVFAGRAVFPQAFTDGFGNGRGGLSIAIYERITYTDGVTTNGSTRLTSATAAFTSDDEDKSITAQNFPSGVTIATYVSPTEVDLSLPATASGTGRSFVIAGRQRSADLATVYSDRLKAVTASNPYIADAAGNAFPYLAPGDYDAVSIHGVTPFSVLPDHEDVEGAVSGLPAHLLDAVDAHDASAISVAPTGSLAATTVQAALAELDAEKQPIDSDLTAIAALSTTAFGRGLLALADGAALAGSIPSGTYVPTAQAFDVLFGSAGEGRVWYDVSAAPFNAVLDNGTNDTAAYQAAINLASTAAAPFGAVIYTPPGRAALNTGAANTPLTFPNFARNITFKGAGPGQPGADGCMLRNASTTGSPMFRFPASAAARVVFDGLRIRQGAAGGAVFDGATNQSSFLYCQWRNCSIDQENPAVPVFDTAGVSEMHTCLMEACDLTQAANATAPLWRMRGTANSFSMNVFDGRGGRFTGTAGSTASCFWLESQNTGFNYGNTFANWCIETPAGGFLTLLSAANTTVEKNEVFDLQVVTVNNHLYTVDKSPVGGATASRQTKFYKCLRRNGGTMGAFFDFNLVAGGANDTVIEECGGAADCGSNTGLTLLNNMAASSAGGSVGFTTSNLPSAYVEITKEGGGRFTDLRTPAIATASLPAAGSTQDGRLVIEDAGGSDRNLLVYAGGRRDRIGQRTTFRRTGALRETYGRDRPKANEAALLSGRLHLAAIDLPSGLTISSITFMSGTTAAVTPTNQWFALYDSALALLRQTADDLTAAWAANAEKTLALSSSFTTTYAGLHYLGIMVAAGTVPSLVAMRSTTQEFTLAPMLTGTSTSGLTTTAPNPAAAMAGSPIWPWAWVG
jgi:hypothetical protein